MAGIDEYLQSASTFALTNLFLVSLSSISSTRTMGMLRDWIFCNAHQQDAAETEKDLRKNFPLLLHENEKIELAFRDRGGKGRDRELFTTHRILIRDGKGIGKKRCSYQSIPYKSIQAFQVETAGKFDGDITLSIWAPGMPVANVDFSEATVDIYEIQQFMNGKVVFPETKGTQDAVDPTPPK